MLDVFLSIVLLVLLGLTVIAGRSRSRGLGEVPIAYRSVMVQFTLNMSVILFVVFSLWLLIFYSWKLLLLSLAIGFVIEAILIVPLLERLILYIVSKMLYGGPR